MALLFLVGPLTVGATTEEIEVLHWWTSDGEGRAVDLLKQRLAQQGVRWRDSAIPGGAGEGAIKVLKSRVIAESAPAAAQIIGPSIREWAQLGFVLPLDKVAADQRWRERLYVTVNDLVRYRGHYVAVPLGIHRINTLYYNRRVFAELRLKPPANWNEFEKVAQAISDAGKIPLGQSSQPWQVGTLFESLVLSEGGSGFYREIFVDLKAAAFLDARLTRSLERLRLLKNWMAPVVADRSWDDIARQLVDGDAGMYIMGDWIGGELAAWGNGAAGKVSCVAVPGTQGMHLYSVDTLVMFSGNGARRSVQEKMAQVLLAPETQIQYARRKGSIPVRRDVAVQSMDPCSRASVRDFAKAEASGKLAPSFVHRMASSETVKNAIVDVLHRYFIDESITTDQTQRRLAAVAQALQEKVN